MKIPGHRRFFRQLIQLFFRSAGQVDENPAVERKRDAFTGGIFPGLRETGSQNRLSLFVDRPSWSGIASALLPQYNCRSGLAAILFAPAAPVPAKDAPRRGFSAAPSVEGFVRKNTIKPRRNCSGGVLLLTLHTINIMPPAAITPPAVAAGRCGRRRWTPVPPAMAGTARESEPRRRPPDCPPAYGCG